MSAAGFWVLIVALAIGTYLLRVVPFLLHGRRPMPAWLRRLLRHVPAAALTTLVVPASVWMKADGAYEFAPARLLALGVAAFVALRWRNMLATLVVGMVALWGLQLLV